MVKNKSISLLGELKSIFMQFLGKTSIVLIPNMAVLSRGCKPRMLSFHHHEPMKKSLKNSASYDSPNKARPIGELRVTNL